MSGGMEKATLLEEPRLCEKRFVPSRKIGERDDPHILLPSSLTTRSVPIASLLRETVSV
jgi:hypothetical protein